MPISPRLCDCALGLLTPGPDCPRTAVVTDVGHFNPVDWTDAVTCLAVELDDKEFAPAAKRLCVRGVPVALAARFRQRRQVEPRSAVSVALNLFVPIDGPVCSIPCALDVLDMLRVSPEAVLDRLQDRRKEALTQRRRLAGTVAAVQSLLAWDQGVAILVQEKAWTYQQVSAAREAVAAIFTKYDWLPRYFVRKIRMLIKKGLRVPASVLACTAAFMWAHGFWLWNYWYEVHDVCSLEFRHDHLPAAFLPMVCLVAADKLEAAMATNNYLTRFQSPAPAVNTQHTADALTDDTNYETYDPEDDEHAEKETNENAGNGEAPKTGQDTAVDDVPEGDEPDEHTAQLPGSEEELAAELEPVQRLESADVPAADGSDFSAWLKRTAEKRVRRVCCALRTAAQTQDGRVETGLLVEPGWDYDLDIAAISSNADKCLSLLADVAFGLVAVHSAGRFVCDLDPFTIFVKDHGSRHKKPARYRALLAGVSQASQSGTCHVRYAGSVGFDRSPSFACDWHAFARLCLFVLASRHINDDIGDVDFDSILCGLAERDQTFGSVEGNRFDANSLQCTGDQDKYDMDSLSDPRVQDLLRWAYGTVARAKQATDSPPNPSQAERIERLRGPGACSPGGFDETKHIIRTAGEPGVLDLFWPPGLEEFVHKPRPRPASASAPAQERGWFGWAGRAWNARPRLRRSR